MEYGVFGRNIKYWFWGRNKKPVPVKNNRDEFKSRYHPALFYGAIDADRTSADLLTEINRISMITLRAHFHRRRQSELAANVQLSGQQLSGYSTFLRINGIFCVDIKYSIEKDGLSVKAFLADIFLRNNKILKKFTLFRNFDWLFSQKMILFTHS